MKLAILLPVAWLALSACEARMLPLVAGSGNRGDFAMAPRALTFQKKGQFGQTDYDQRREDMIACGMPRERYNEDLSYLGSSRNETAEQFIARRKKFVQCLKDKGYVWLSLGECGPVKENRGICK